MAQRSRFFDSSGGDRIYTSDAWAQVVGAIIGDGVVATGNELAVAEASPPAMSVRVNTGKAFIGGYYFEVHTGQETLAIAAAHATLARIDRVVVRRDLAGRTAVLAVLTGTPAEPPTAPALTQVAAGVWEIAPRVRSRSPPLRPRSSTPTSPTSAARGRRAPTSRTSRRRSSTRRAAIATRARPARAARSATPTSRGSRPTTTTPSPTPTAATGRARVAHAATTGQTATDHHAAPVAGPDANVTVDAAGAAGTAGAFARSGHGHQVATSGATPADVAAAGAAGATGALARAGARPRPRLGLPARRPPPAGPRPELAHGHRRRHQRLGAGIRGRRRGGREGLGRHDRSRRLGGRGRHLGEEVSREA